MSYPMDALLQSDDFCSPRPIIPMAQLSLMTTSPNLTLHGDVLGIPFSLPTIPSLLTYSPSSNSDVEDNTLHDNDANIGPSVADLTAYVSSFDLSSLSSASNVKKTYLSSLTAQAAKATLGQSELSLKFSMGFSEGEISNSKQPLLSETASILYQSYPTQNSVRFASPKMPTQIRSTLPYDLIGTIRQGVDRKVLLVGLKGNLKGGLYVLKTVRQEDPSSLMNVKMAEELALHHLVTRSSPSDQLGVHFLQVLVDSFQDGGFLYMILEHHPTTLSVPETAASFRIHGEYIPALHASGSLPSTLTDHSSASVSPNRVVDRLRLLIAEISLGLLYLHKRGIVHQDIKPANIMVSKTGHIVISDFGAASKLPPRNPTLFHASLASTSGRSCTPNEYGPIVLQPDDFITFTPMYAAPELRHRNQTGLVVYDSRADWWSLGILIRELITGAAPDVIPTLQHCPRSDGDQSLLFGPLESLSALNSNKWCPPLENLLRLLLTYDPDERLSGLNVKGHSFFDPIRELWAEIAALKYPPCPNPSMDQSASFHLEPQQTSLYQHVSASRVVDKCHSFGVHWDVSMGLYTHSAHRPTHDFGGQSFQKQSAMQEPNTPPINSYEESDQGSELQALPSTASIYFNSLEVDNTLVREISDSGVDIVTVNGPTDVLSEPVRRLNLNGPSISRYPSKHRLDSPFSLHKVRVPSKSPLLAEQEDWVEHSTNKPLTLVSGSSITSLGLVLPEKITLSLLEAMDNRDRRRTVSRQCPTMKSRKEPAKKDHPQRLLRAVAQRILRRLHFW